MTATVTERTRDGVIESPDTPALMSLADAMPGRKRWEGRKLVFELTRKNIEHVEAHLPDAQWVNPARRDEVRALREQEASTAPATRGGFEFKTEPRDYQLTAFERARDKHAFGFFLEMGLGKTKVCIDNAAWLYDQGKIDGLLVTAPNGVQHQWTDEQVPQHMPDRANARTLVYTAAKADTKRWQKEFAELCEHPGLAVFANNVEAYSSKKGAQYAAKFLHARRCMWAFDESIRIKTPGAKRTKTVIKLGQLAPYRRILTGAPITNGIEDLFSQFKFLDADILGFSSFYTFRNRYCQTAPIPGAPPGAVRIVGYKNEDELKEKLRAWTQRERAADVLGLPERVYGTREVALTASQRRLYASLRDELVAELENGTLVTAQIALTKLLRLQQVLGGYLIDEETGAAVPVDNNRIAIAKEVAEEAQGKVVVWARFKAEMQGLKEAFADWNPAVWDEPKERAANKRKFLDDDTCRVFLANPQSAGTGLDGLQHASRTMIYYSNSFSANDRWQSEARLHRSGQKGTVNVIDLVAPNTVDEEVQKALRRKKGLADSTVDDIRALLKA